MPAMQRYRNVKISNLTARDWLMQESFLEKKNVTKSLIIYSNGRTQPAVPIHISAMV